MMEIFFSFKIIVIIIIILVVVISGLIIFGLWLWNLDYCLIFRWIDLLCKAKKKPSPNFIHPKFIYKLIYACDFTNVPLQPKTCVGQVVRKPSKFWLTSTLNPILHFFLTIRELICQKKNKVREPNHHWLKSSGIARAINPNL